LLNSLDQWLWKAPGAFSQYTLRRSSGVFVAFGPGKKCRRWRKSAVSGVVTVVDFVTCVISADDFLQIQISFMRGFR